VRTRHSSLWITSRCSSLTARTDTPQSRARSLPASDQRRLNFCWGDGHDRSWWCLCKLLQMGDAGKTIELVTNGAGAQRLRRVAGWLSGASKWLDCRSTRSRSSCWVRGAVPGEARGRENCHNGGGLCSSVLFEWSELHQGGIPYLDMDMKDKYGHVCKCRSLYCQSRTWLYRLFCFLLGVSLGGSQDSNARACLLESREQHPGVGIAKRRRCTNGSISPKAGGHVCEAKATHTVPALVS